MSLHRPSIARRRRQGIMASMGLGFSEGDKVPRSEHAERVTIDSSRVQLALALMSYAEKHGERGIDFIDPRTNDPQVKTAAMGEWLAVQTGESFSARYRAYVEAHPTEQIDLADEAALSELLARVLG